MDTKKDQYKIISYMGKLGIYYQLTMGNRFIAIAYNIAVLNDKIAMLKKEKRENGDF